MRPIDADWFKKLVLSKKEADPYIVGVMINAIDAMPTIEDRKKGKWVSNHDGTWNCSECGLRVLVYGKGNFCPNCGADMRGEHENE